MGPQLDGGELSAIIKTFMPFPCLCLLDKSVVTVKISLEGFLFYLVEIGVPFGEGNGTTLQYSCLENPWTEEPGGLQSIGSQRAGLD